jgi:DNA-binding transcriptional LysR family regulator
MGMRLFDRDQAGVRLTAQGRWVVDKAEVLLTNATDFSNQVAFAAKGVEGRIRFGLTAMAAHLLLPTTMTRRLNETPQFIHDVLIRESEPLYLMLAQGQIEFLICTELSSVWSIPEVMQVSIECLGKLPVSLVVRKGHPLLDGGKNVDRFPILVSSPASVSGQTTLSLLDSIGSNIQVIEDLGIISSNALRSNACWLTCPLVLAELGREDDLISLPLPDNIGPKFFDIYCYYLTKRSISPTATAIINEYSAKISSYIPQLEIRKTSD